MQINSMGVFPCALNPFNCLQGAQEQQDQGHSRFEWMQGVANAVSVILFLGVHLLGYQCTTR